MIKDYYSNDLSSNEFAFGPNTETLLNFWSVIDNKASNLSRTEKVELTQDYYDLSKEFEERRRLLIRLEDEYDYPRVLYYSFSVFGGSIDLQMWLRWSSLEIIHAQKLLDDGNRLMFLPKLIQQLEHYGAL